MKRKHMVRASAILLACAFFIVLLPVASFAGGNGPITDLWVNNVNILDGGEVDGVSFDADDQKLTLNNANIDTPCEDTPEEALIYSAGGDLSIEITGENTIGSQGCSYGIRVEGGALDISGSGTLSVSGFFYGINSDGDMTIDAGIPSLIASGNFALMSEYGDIIVGETPYITLAGDVRIEYGEITHDLADLWVNGVDILNGGQVPGVDFDAETLTLTLTNAVIDTGYESGFNSGIFAMGDLNLVLNGVNVISGDNVKEGISILSGDLTIGGSGSLLISSEQYAVYVKGIFDISSSVSRMIASSDSTALFSEIDVVNIGGEPYSGTDTSVSIEYGRLETDVSPVYELWVDNVNILDGGEVDGVRFDSRIGVLTLDGAVIDTPCKAGWDDGIYACGDLTVVLKGDNVVSGDLDYGIDVDPGSLAIIGDGSLITEGFYTGIYADSFNRSDFDIFIGGGTINAVGTDDGGANGIYAFGNILICGGDVTAVCTTDFDEGLCAIYAEDQLIVLPMDGESIYVTAGEDKDHAAYISGSPFNEREDIWENVGYVGYFRSVATIPNSVTPLTQTYDKNGFYDTVFTITSSEDVTLKALYVGDTKLTADTDYFLSGNRVMFTESYRRTLNQINGQTLTVTFDMSEREDPSVELVIPETYAITILSDPEDSGDWVLDGYSNGESVCYVQKGETAGLAAYEYIGYTFVGWEIDGEIVCEDPYFEYKPDSDCTLKMIFEKLPCSLGADPDTIDFGRADPGYTEAPQAQTVTVTNTGVMALMLMSPVSEYYDIEGPEDYYMMILEPGDSAEFVIRPKAGLENGIYDETIEIYARMNNIVARAVLFAAPLASPEFVNEVNEEEGPVFYYDAVVSVDVSFRVGEDYTLTFESNGGSELEPVTEFEGTVIELDEYMPSRDGYDFAGWYSDPDLTDKVTSVTLNSNKTVYAAWTEIPVQDDDPVIPDNPPDSAPETNDNANTLLWIMLLCTSCAGISGILFYNEKRKVKK